MKNRTHQPSWHRLDNTANVFPLISHKNFTNVFRLAVELKEMVQPELLQKALDVTLPEFGNFNFRIRRGFFWYYFEPTNNRALVQLEHTRPCAYIDTKSKHHHLFRIIYYKKRISLEVFHAITDGTGATNFLKALTINYLKLVHSESLPESTKRLKVNSELEDSYAKYSKKSNEAKEKIPRAFRLKGKLLPINTIGVFHGYLQVPQVVAHCKSVDVTLTEYLSSLYAWSIYTSYLENGILKKPVHLSVPVNLRRFFESTTNMNFFSYITIAIPVSDQTWTFDEVLEAVKNQFRTQVTKENMQKNISKDVALRHNPATRGLPLFLKNFFVKWVHLSATKSYTSTLSNVGKVELPERWIPDVDHFELLMNTSALDPMKCAICAFEDKLVVTISSQLENPNIQKIFFRKLAEDGMDVVLESNGVYYEIL